MEFGAAAIVSELHGRCFRAVTKALGHETDGLSVAARRAKSAGMIGKELAKALNRLDVAFAVNRHRNEVKAANFYSQLSDALWGLSADGAEAGMAEGACKQPQFGIF